MFVKKLMRKSYFQTPKLSVYYKIVKLWSAFPNVNFTPFPVLDFVDQDGIKEILQERP